LSDHVCKIPRPFPWESCQKTEQHQASPSPSANRLVLGVLWNRSVRDREEPGSDRLRMRASARAPDRREFGRLLEALHRVAPVQPERLACAGRTLLLKWPLFGLADLLVRNPLVPCPDLPFAPARSLRVSARAPFDCSHPRWHAPD